MTHKAIRRLFIANRGEILRRIATTARRLGIETVALSSRATPPCYLAGVVSQFIAVPEETPALYLDGEQLIKLALQAGCDSVHPGFGFLSENAGFAESCLRAGLIWVGPHPKAINAMASKAAARLMAEEAKVPCIKGLSGFPVPDSEAGDFSELITFARQTGYPLLLKAAMGGGGKGMRLVHAETELRPAALRAYSEAKNAFGDGHLVCEQYLTSPRHVEVQILADQHGHVYALADRDCSVQRRHQKIIEEAPAPGLTAETRRAMQEAAVRLAAAVGYDSAGTVEFLVDWSEPARQGSQQRFYFLEMNTRLQVEHPVTEEILGIDLVEWQLRIAQGETLPASFGSLTPRGHSVEVRLYAEDVNNDFFPAPGPVAAFIPYSGPGIRWEIGIDALDEVSGSFDPMVAKLVATGEDRSTALARLAAALQGTFFAGPPANLELLHEIVTASPFVHQPVTTHFLAEHLPELLTRLGQQQAEYEGLAKSIFEQLETKSLAQGSPLTSATAEGLTALAFTKNSSFSSPKAGTMAQSDASLTVRPNILQEAYLSAEGRSSLHGMGLIKGGVDGRELPFWYASSKTVSARHLWVSVDGTHFSLMRTKARATHSSEGHQTSSEILAPVPGKVITVSIATGDEVKANQSVFILESMKMQFEVKAAKAGLIGTIKVRPGDQVTAGQLLAVWADN